MFEEIMDSKDFYTKQVTLTDWLEQLGKEDFAKLREEDTWKRERMAKLNELIGLPFDRPTQFLATEVDEANDEFARFLEAKGDELCAIRLNPLDPTMPKPRIRGMSIKDAFSWFKEQGVDKEKYKVDFVPHPKENFWSTIFVVNEQGIFGEIIAGRHNQLTQGFYQEGAPITFAKPWGEDWQFSETNEGAMEHMKKAVAILEVAEEAMQEKLAAEVGVSFVEGYIKGYFETVESEHGIWFIDYNRLLEQDFAVEVKKQQEAGEQELVGQTGCKGKVTGRVRVVEDLEAGLVEFREGEVLVCSMTTPQYLPLMLTCSGIVTDQGGVLSHAAIVARELHKPCVVGTRIATQILSTGDLVEVDGENGVVRVLERA